MCVDSFFSVPIQKAISLRHVAPESGQLSELTLATKPGEKATTSPPPGTKQGSANTGGNVV